MHELVHPVARDAPRDPQLVALWIGDEVDVRLSRLPHAVGSLLPEGRAGRKEARPRWTPGICSNRAMVVGQFALETHLVVLGGGAGGYAAALRAAKLGVETMLVDAATGPAGTAPGTGSAAGRQSALQSASSRRIGGAERAQSR